MSGPLAGIRVVDVSPLLPGPYATRLLADLGADVVKVEHPAGDGIRHLLPGVYEFLARGKRIVRLDLKTAAGREAAHSLLAQADVVVESFRPGVADRLDIGFERARELQPRVVYCSISGFGQTGDRRAEPGHDIAYEAAGGAFAGVLAAGETPTRPHLPIGDLGAASFAALSIVAAVRDPQRAEAVHLDVSMLECVTYLAVTRWGTALLDGAPPAVESLGNYSPGHRIYATADGRHVALAAVEDRFWSALATVLARPDLAAPPYDTHAQRMAHRQELEQMLTSEFARWPAERLLATCEAHDVPVTAVLDAGAAADSPILHERGAITDLPGGGMHLDFPVRANGHRSWARTEPDPGT